MNIKEMHIDINQQLQRIDASAQDWFEPEELDLAIYREMVRFIKTHYNPAGNRYFEGFENSTKRIQDLRHLIVPSYTDITFVSEEDDKLVKFPFPSDHMLLTRVRPRSNYVECSSSISTSVGSVEFSYADLFFDMFYSKNSISSFDIEVVFSGGGTQSILSSSFKNNLSVYSFPEDWPYFLRALIDDASANYTYEVRWESYKNVYEKDKLIVETGDTATSVKLTVDGNVTQDVSTKKSNPKYYSFTGEEGTLKFEYVRGSYSQLHDIDMLLEDPFNTTRPKKPLFTIRNNYIEFYVDEDFYVDSARIDYIRWPKRVSRNRNQDCELPESTHDEIVANTVAHLSGVIADQRYKILESEAQKSE